MEMNVRWVGLAWLGVEVRVGVGVGLRRRLRGNED